MFNLSPVLWRVNFCKKQAYLTKEHQHAGLFKECTFIVAKFAKGNQQDKSRIAFPAIINFGRLKFNNLLAPARRQRGGNHRRRSSGTAIIVFESNVNRCTKQRSERNGVNYSNLLNIQIDTSNVSGTSTVQFLSEQTLGQGNRPKSFQR